MGDFSSRWFSDKKLLRISDWRERKGRGKAGGEGRRKRGREERVDVINVLKRKPFLFKV